MTLPTEKDLLEELTCDDPERVAAAVRRQVAATRAMLAGAEAEPRAPLPPGKPRISVLVSAYASGADLPVCLTDLLAQTVARDLEIIVVDAASPQDERAVTREFRKRFAALRYIRTRERVSVYAAWNIAILCASGEYLLPFSTNDRLNPDACRVLSSALRQRPDVALVYGDSFRTSQPGLGFREMLDQPVIKMFKWPEYRYEDFLRINRIGPHPMWRKSVHDVVGLFDDRLRALGDQEFWSRLGRRFPMLHVEAVTGVYLESEASLSAGDQAKAESATIRRLYNEIYLRDKDRRAELLRRARDLVREGKEAEARTLLDRAGTLYGHVDDDFH